MTETEFIKAKLELYKLLLGGLVVSMFYIVLLVIQTEWKYFFQSITAILGFGSLFVLIGIIYANDMKRLRNLR